MVRRARRTFVDGLGCLTETAAAPQASSPLEMATDPPSVNSTRRSLGWMTVNIHVYYTAPQDTRDLQSGCDIKSDYLQETSHLHKKENDSYGRHTSSTRIRDTREGDFWNEEPLPTLWKDVFAYQILASPSVKKSPHGGLDILRGANRHT
jgi:hypothetical protein